MLGPPLPGKARKLSFSPSPKTLVSAFLLGNSGQRPSFSNKLNQANPVYSAAPQGEGIGVICRMDTVPRAGTCAYFPRKRGREQQEVGGRRRRKAGQNTERRGRSQFIPTRYKASSLFQRQTPPGMAEPRPTSEVKSLHQTVLECGWVLTQTPASTDSAHSPVLST